MDCERFLCLAQFACLLYTTGWKGFYFPLCKRWLLVRESVGLATVNCQELTTYEWSQLGDATEDQQLDVEVLMNACQERQNV